MIGRRELRGAGRTRRPGPRAQRWRPQMSRINAKPRGRPFAPGTPGKPRGARHRVTRAVEALMEGEHERLTRIAIDKALEGDTAALRLCLDRIARPRRDAPVSI